MWKRKTFHECANELASISERFRLAHTNTLPKHLAGSKNDILMECSVKGVDLLKVLALSIRAEQDYGILQTPQLVVGAYKEGITSENTSAYKTNYHGQYQEYCKEEDFDLLYIRQALNKIAHANPEESSFYAEEQVHDLILIGANRGNKWIATLSLLDLVKALRALPDREIP